MEPVVPYQVRLASRVMPTEYSFKTGIFALAKKELFTDIGLPALKAVEAEVIGISDSPLMKRVQSPVSAYLLRNREGFLTKET